LRCAISGSRERPVVRALLAVAQVTAASVPGRVPRPLGPGTTRPTWARRRGACDQLFERVFDEYVTTRSPSSRCALACEGASNVLTSARVGSAHGYLEQSTRYISYNERHGGHWRYLVPPELAAGPLRRSSPVPRRRLCHICAVIEPLETHLRAKHPKEPGDSERVPAHIAPALDALRGLLPPPPSPTSVCSAPGRRTKPCAKDAATARRGPSLC